MKGLFFLKSGHRSQTMMLLPDIQVCILNLQLRVQVFKSSQIHGMSLWPTSSLSLQDDGISSRNFRNAESLANWQPSLENSAIDDDLIQPGLLLGYVREEREATCSAAITLKAGKPRTLDKSDLRRTQRTPGMCPQCQA